ncbi:transcriptional regulator [Streptomyces mashuensis]|uniref:Transcriptional regulator n=1 Tax=Streptomyces mashuensis TaxID=33904 RepID=A0A919B4F2_9ACTN|nr:helix-turn-helix transcriptional regulator [Streptomyces mashuensis]GHF46385.1 transcriptional regulator [Streptomyces mashuensis]
MAMGSRGAGRIRQGKLGWDFFGSELKLRREKFRLSQDELGRRVFCSGSYIGQFEAGRRKPQKDVAQRIDTELETDGFFVRVCEELIDSTGAQHYFAEAAYLESIATEIHTYTPMFVPGLFQTAAYAFAVFRGAFPLAEKSEVEAWVTGRLERQYLVEQAPKPVLWAVIDEHVLRRPTGGAAVMHEQLARLAELARRERIVMQVLPFSSGAPVLGGYVKLMAFDDAPPVAYTEGAMSGSLLDDPALVAKLQLAYDFARAAALPREASLALVESVAEEYGR